MIRTFFLYVEENSPLIKLHPLLKILLLLIINLEAWIIEAPLFLLVIILALLISYKLLRIPLSRIAKFLVLAIVIVQAIMFSYLLGSTIPGTVIYAKLPWGTYISDMTLLYTFTVILRFLTMLIGSTLILAVMRDIDIIYGLKSLKIPFSFAFMISLAFRMSSIFLNDFFKIRDAMILRGTNFSSGNVIDKARNYSKLAVPLMVLGVRRMVELSYILEIKGLGLRKRRTFLYDFPLKPYDKFLIIFLITLLTISIIGKFFWKIFTFPGWPFI